MQLEKFDLFVSPVKNPDPSKNEHYYLQQRLMMKLYDILARDYGLEATINLDDSVWDLPFTESEINKLNEEPFYISEHYLTRVLILDPVVVPNRPVVHPIRARPAIDSYNYANNGSWAKNQWRIMGAANTGKTLIALILRELIETEIPGAKVIFCENPYAFPGHEPMKDPENLAFAKERLKTMKVKFSPFPITRISVDNELHHEVNF